MDRLRSAALAGTRKMQLRVNMCELFVQYLVYAHDIT